MLLGLSLAGLGLLGSLVAGGGRPHVGHVLFHWLAARPGDVLDGRLEQVLHLSEALRGRDDVRSWCS